MELGARGLQKGGYSEVYSPDVYPQEEGGPKAGDFFFEIGNEIFCSEREQKSPETLGTGLISGISEKTQFCIL